MKHLRRFFESVGITKEDVLDNFQYITDKLGEPVVYQSKFGEAKKWTLVWNLGLDVTHIQEAHTLINKLKSIVVGYCHLEISYSTHKLNSVEKM